MASSDWAAIASTTALGAAGLYFANSVRRRTRADLDREVSQKRFTAYAALWAEMAVVSPMRVIVAEANERAGSDEHGEPLDSSALFDKLTHWYYSSGNGMLLSPGTRNIYLAAKENLLCPPENFRPSSASADVARCEREREKRVIRQLSLLRTSMRGDLAIYTTPWGSDLDDEDIAFLTACDVDPNGEAWRRSLPDRHIRRVWPF